MVSTRRSRAGVAASSSPPPSGTLDTLDILTTANGPTQVPRELQKLAIDANPALCGQGSLKRKRSSANAQLLPPTPPKSQSEASTHTSPQSAPTGQPGGASIPASPTPHSSNGRFKPSKRRKMEHLAAPTTPTRRDAVSAESREDAYTRLQKLTSEALSRQAPYVNPLAYFFDSEVSIDQPDVRSAYTSQASPEPEVKLSSLRPTLQQSKTTESPPPVVLKLRKYTSPAKESTASSRLGQKTPERGDTIEEVEAKDDDDLATLDTIRVATPAQEDTTTKDDLYAKRGKKRHINEHFLPLSKKPKLAHDFVRDTAPPTHTQPAKSLPRTKPATTTKQTQAPQTKKDSFSEAYTPHTALDTKVENDSKTHMSEVEALVPSAKSVSPPLDPQPPIINAAVRTEVQQDEEEDELTRLKKRKQAEKAARELRRLQIDAAPSLITGSVNPAAETSSLKQDESKVSASQIAVEPIDAKHKEEPRSTSLVEATVTETPQPESAAIEETTGGEHPSQQQDATSKPKMSREMRKLLIDANPALGGLDHAEPSTKRSRKPRQSTLPANEETAHIVAGQTSIGTLSKGKGIARATSPPVWLSQPPPQHVVDGFLRDVAEIAGDRDTVEALDRLHGFGDVQGVDAIGKAEGAISLGRKMAETAEEREERIRREIGIMAEWDAVEPDVATEKEAAQAEIAGAEARTFTAEDE